MVVVTDPLRAQVAQNRPPQSGPKTFGLAAVGDVGKILVAKEPILVAPEPIVVQEPGNKNGNATWFNYLRLPKRRKLC